MERSDDPPNSLAEQEPLADLFGLPEDVAKLIYSSLLMKHFARYENVPEF
jgi:hypothetical protein